MQDQVELMQDLIRVSGESCEEQRISDKLRELLIDAGVPARSIRSDDAHKRSAYGGETGNLIVTLDGDRSSDRIMLSTHMDTIPIAVGSKPEVVDGRLIDGQPGHSLGGDARAGCAILLGAI
ncbi:MAG: peptidase M20, partial [Verrucomicrobiota bacterium]